jgi:Na+/melibiose symporter-like transporter
VFLVNIPIVIFGLLAGFFVIPTSKDPHAGKLDPLGAILSIAGLTALLYAIIEAPVKGWGSTETLVVGAVGLVLLVVFVLWERHSTHPMLDVNFFKKPRFTAASLSITLVFFAMFGSLFLLTQYFQFVLGYSPLEAGLALMPITLLLLLLSPRAGRLSQRVGPRLPMTIGPVVAGAGLALLWRVEPGSSYLTAILPGIAVFGLGLSLLVAPLTATVLAAAPTRHAGLASAVNNAVARAAGLIAVAALPAIAGLTGAVYGDPGRFSDGFSIAMLVCAGLCLAGGVIAYATAPGRAATRERTVTSEFSCAVDAPPLRGDACEAGAC